MDTPFHYELELGYWDKSIQKPKRVLKFFKEENPILARNKAFEEYNEMEGWIATYNNVAPEDLIGNDSLLNSEFGLSDKEQEILKNLSVEDYIQLKNSIGISVYLVLDLDVDETDLKGKRYIIHGLYNSCYLDYWESLSFEKIFYEYFECDTGDKEVEITIFVADPLVNDYETEVILDTPLDWSQYREPEEEYVEYLKRLSNKLDSVEELGIFLACP